MTVARFLFRLLCNSVEEDQDRAEVFAELVNLMTKWLRDNGEDWRL